MLTPVDAEELPKELEKIILDSWDSLSSQGYKFAGGYLVFFPERDLGYVWEDGRVYQYMSYHPEGIIKKWELDFSGIFDGPEMMKVEDEDYPTDDRD